MDSAKRIVFGSFDFTSIEAVLPLSKRLGYIQFWLMFLQQSPLLPVKETSGKRRQKITVYTSATTSTCFTYQSVPLCTLQFSLNY